MSKRIFFLKVCFLLVSLVSISSCILGIIQSFDTFVKFAAVIDKTLVANDVSLDWRPAYLFRTNFEV